MSRTPWGVLAGVGAAAALHLTVTGPAMQYERSAVAAGEWWRLLAAQLVHWTDAMAAADLTLVLLAGAIVEHQARRTALAAALAGMAASALALQLAAPAIDVYRGSSGIGSALLAAAAAMAWRRSGRVLAGAVMSLFAAKVLVDLTAGGWSSLPAGIAPVPIVHLAGAGAGLLAAIVFPGPQRVEWRSPEAAGVGTGAAGCCFLLDTGPVVPTRDGRFPGASRCGTLGPAPPPRSPACSSRTDPPTSPLPSATC